MRRALHVSSVVLVICAMGATLQGKPLDGIAIMLAAFYLEYVSRW